MIGLIVLIVAIVLVLAITPFVLDEKGYKMSKSMGNVVDPLKMMEQYGADILRLWVMTSDYAEDIRIGKNTLKNTGDLYRRIRNTLRFLLGALDGFTKAESVEFSDDACSGKVQGLLTHGQVRVDKDDVQPQPELINMLLTL